MGERTGIAWCDHTFNPWWGCREVSPGCDHCYARELAQRFGKHCWGPLAPRIAMSDAYWRQPLRWDRAAKAAGCSALVFCASMADVFETRRGDPVVAEARARLWPLIEQTPHLVWLLLTKRPASMLHCPPKAWARGWPSNAWALTTVESAKYTWRIDELLKVPAMVHGVSYEPALGPVDWSPWLRDIIDAECERIDWLIVGGESGDGAREFDPEWARQALGQAKGSTCRVFVKQMGSHCPALSMPGKGDDPAQWPPSLRVREWPEVTRDA